MDFQALYKSKLTTAAEAVKLVKSGDWVDYTWCTNHPIELDKALAARQNELEDVKANMDLLNYKEMVIQAIYASSDDEVKAIVESFRAQLKAAGIDRLYDYCEAIYAENPETIQLIPVEATVAE